MKKAKSTPGYDGVNAYGGIIDLGEGDRDLLGANRWKTIANMYRRPPVAVWARLRAALFSGVTWTATPNESGGSDADRGAEVVEQGLLKARLGRGTTMRPWTAVAARAIGGAAALGFSVAATSIARRKDGLVTFTDIASRPQHTIERFRRENDSDETTPFVSAEQRGNTGTTYRIPLAESLYVVNDNGTLSESPMGAGMLFLIAERVRRSGVYEPLEGSELVSSMGGIPITRAPLEELNGNARQLLKDDPDAEKKLSAVIAEKLRPLREFVQRRYKDPSKLAWYELDSATYVGTNPNTITGNRKWDLEIVKGELQGLADIRKIINDLDLDVARMLGVEHVWMGGGDTAGTYGSHESKITALGAAVNSEVGAFAYVATQQLARRLVAANGLDPDTATPTLTPSPVMRADVLRAVDAIVKLQMAQLKPNHPAKKAVFEGVDLPWEEEDESSMMLPRAPMPPPPADPNAPPPKEEAPADPADPPDPEDA